MFNSNGWKEYCIWEHSSTIKELYAKRCRLIAPEMACAAQAAELLAPWVSAGDTLLDVGCGSGYFYHSLKKRQIDVNYFGIDAAPTLIEIGRNILPSYGLPSERLQVVRIEDLAGYVDHVVCINVLSNLENFHRPLERLLKLAQKSLVLRESISDFSCFQYVTDKYLDQGHPLKVYVNTYKEEDIVSFIRSHGFSVKSHVDRYTHGQPQIVIDYPHYWKFIVAQRS